jgi:hypothetical protein
LHIFGGPLFHIAELRSAGLVRAPAPNALEKQHGLFSMGRLFWAFHAVYSSLHLRNEQLPHLNLEIELVVERRGARGGDAKVVLHLGDEYAHFSEVGFRGGEVVSWSGSWRCGLRGCSAYASLSGGLRTGEQKNGNEAGEKRAGWHGDLLTRF